MNHPPSLALLLSFLTPLLQQSLISSKLGNAVLFCRLPPPLRATFPLWYTVSHEGISARSRYWPRIISLPTVESWDQGGGSKYKILAKVKLRELLSIIHLQDCSRVSLVCGKKEKLMNLTMLSLSLSNSWQGCRQIIHQWKATWQRKMTAFGIRGIEFKMQLYLLCFNTTCDLKQFP